MKRAIVGLCLALMTSMAWALPSVQDVEAATRQGRYTEAETMMAEVVAAKPSSARAHYIYAELLAHNANFARAAEEAGKARELDPKITFADPDKFRSFEQTLERQRTPASRPSPLSTQSSSGAVERSSMNESSMAPARGGIPGWVWLAGLVIIGIAVWRMIGRRSAGGMAGGQPGMQNGYPNGPAGTPPGGFPGQGGMPMQQGYGPQGYGPQQAGRAGGGLLGTGMAVAGGVAGGMLLDQMLNRHAEAGTTHNLGGLDPNTYNPANDAASDLENRQVDFGTGGDSWDSGGGSLDSGGDSSGGGWD